MPSCNIIVSWQWRRQLKNVQSPNKFALLVSSKMSQCTFMEHLASPLSAKNFPTVLCQSRSRGVQTPNIRRGPDSTHAFLHGDAIGSQISHKPSRHIRSRFILVSQISVVLWKYKINNNNNIIWIMWHISSFHSLYAYCYNYYRKIRSSTEAVQHLWLIKVSSEKY